MRANSASCHGTNVSYELWNQAIRISCGFVSTNMRATSAVPTTLAQMMTTAAVRKCPVANK